MPLYNIRNLFISLRNLLELLTLSAKLRHGQPKGSFSSTQIGCGLVFLPFGAVVGLADMEISSTLFNWYPMNEVDNMIQQAENDIYRELLAVADDFSDLKASFPRMYQTKAVEAMTAVAKMASRSEAIRQFFLSIDKDPDQAMDELLQKAIQSL